MSHDRLSSLRDLCRPRRRLLPRRAAWLGWDSVTGQSLAQPALDGLPRPVADMTAKPRKYGLHGTVKPPFRLADGTTEADLRSAVAETCARLSAVEVPALSVRRLGGFVAVVPTEPSPQLAAMAGPVVKELDAFRAPPTEAELAKRRKSGLTPRQEALLAKWGYPYVLDEFRFHITLTGKLGREAEAVAERCTPISPRSCRTPSGWAACA